MELGTTNIVGEIFKDYHPHTELGVDLKFFTRQAGRMEEGQSLWGVITFDGELHFTFIEDALVEKKAAKRNACVLPGKYVNLHRADDGTFYFAFKKPMLNDVKSFINFCEGAAHELRSIAGLVKKKNGDFFK